MFLVHIMTRQEKSATTRYKGGNTQFRLESKIAVFFGFDGRWRSVGEMMWKVMGECLCNLSRYDWCPLWELQWYLQSDTHKPVIHPSFLQHTIIYSTCNETCQIVMLGQTLTTLLDAAFLLTTAASAAESVMDGTNTTSFCQSRESAGPRYISMPSQVACKGLSNSLNLRWVVICYNIS